LIDWLIDWLIDRLIDLSHFKWEFFLAACRFYCNSKMKDNGKGGIHDHSLSLLGAWTSIKSGWEN
jgi:hypothetical protein